MPKKPSGFSTWKRHKNPKLGNETVRTELLLIQSQTLVSWPPSPRHGCHPTFSLRHDFLVWGIPTHPRPARKNRRKSLNASMLCFARYLWVIAGTKKTKTPFVSNKFPTSYLSYPLFSGGPNFSPKRWTVWKVGVFEGSNFRPPMTASVLSTLHWKDQRWRGLTICEWQTANSRIGQEKWSQKALYTKFLFKKKNVDYFFTWACALLLGFSENINTIISSLWCSRWLQGRSSISSALHQESMGFSKETVEGQDTPFAKSFHHFFRVQQFLFCFFSPDPKCFWFVPFLPFVPVDRCHKNSRKKSGKLT